MRLLAHLVLPALCSLAVPTGWLVLNIFRQPAGSPSSQGRGGSSADRTVALLGDSHTHGFFGHNWVADLGKRHPELVLVNAGMNSNLAWNLNERLTETLQLQPDAAVVLIGSNDAMGSFNEDAARGYVLAMQLPQLPTADFFRTNLRSVLARLRQAGVKQRAVVTLPPLGEDPTSEINTLIEAFNEDIRTIALESEAALLPLNEKMWEMIRGKRRMGLDGPAQRLEYLPDNRRVWPMVKAAVQHNLIGKSWDDIADENGLVVLNDAIHMSSRGADLLADLVSDFLQGEQQRENGTARSET